MPRKKKQKLMTAEELREHMPVLLNEVLNPILKGEYYHNFDADATKTYIEHLYNYCDYKPPGKFYVTENPLESLALARDILKKPNYTYSFFYAASIYSAAYWSWYKFVKDNCKPDFEKAADLDEFYTKYMASPFFSAVLETDFAIVSKAPLRIEMMNERLHCEDGPAMDWAQDFQELDDCYFWKGTLVPKQLIMEPDSLTQKDLLDIKNAEMRRCYVERLGVSRFHDILGKGGLKKIDEDIDHQGHPMRLYEFKFEGETVQVLEVIDPSAKRRYDIYPPKKCKNVWEAKASTFGGEKLAYRQGDVGLVNINKAFDRPLIET